MFATAGVRLGRAAAAAGAVAGTAAGSAILLRTSVSPLAMPRVDSGVADVSGGICTAGRPR